MVLNVHKKTKQNKTRFIRDGEKGMEVGEEEDYIIPIATLSPLE